MAETLVYGNDTTASIVTRVWLANKSTLCNSNNGKYTGLYTEDIPIARCYRSYIMEYIGNYKWQNRMLNDILLYTVV